MKFMLCLKRKKPLKWITSIGNPSRVQKVFQESLVEQAKASSDEIEALRFALNREDSIKYYEVLAEQTEDNKEKRFYLALFREERNH